MEQIKKQLVEAVDELYGIKPEVDLGLAPEETGADYATNLAMQLAKLVHRAPMVIAESLREKLEDEGGDFELTIAAPGFMNFRMKDAYFAQKVWNLKDAIVRGGENYTGKTVVAEFSDPNPFKVLHVGHFYTSVVGDAISRLLEWSGAKVIRANFGGDVGLHVGKTIYALLEKSYTVADLTIEQIAECYVEGTRAYEEDEQAKAKIVGINKAVYALAELGEEKSRERLELEQIAEDFDLSTMEVARIAELYWRGREISYEYFKKFYAEIGIKFDKFYPESTVAGRGLKEVREHVGTTYEESDGAIVYHGEKRDLHTRVFINREGVPTYETKDVGLLFTKWDDWHFDESVVVTGNEQTDYMKVVLASVSEYAPKLVERTTHLTHGLVKLPGNVKMSSRKGNFLKAVDVLEMVREMLGGASADEKVVLAAIKYAFLKYKMGGDIIFDPEESVSTNGNSGVYLLYAAVRAKKVLQKIGDKKDVSRGDDSLVLEEPAVRALNKKLVQYEEILYNAAMEKAPHKVCTYLYELAQEFSRFYENVKVVGNEREAELSKLVETYLYVMEHGLALLGIEVPEEM